MGQIYLPNYDDPRIKAFCAFYTQPSTVTGFRNALLEATGASPALSTDDLWQIYMATLKGSFKGQHMNNYEPEGAFKFPATTYNFSNLDDNLIYSIYFNTGGFISDTLGDFLVYCTTGDFGVRAATGMTFNSIRNTTCSNALLYFSSFSVGGSGTFQVSIENPGSNPGPWVEEDHSPYTILTDSPRPLVTPISVSHTPQTASPFTIDVTGLVQEIMAQSWWTSLSRINFVLYPNDVETFKSLTVDLNNLTATLTITP